MFWWPVGQEKCGSPSKWECTMPEVADLEDLEMETSNAPQNGDDAVDLEEGDKKEEKEKRTRKTWAKSNKWFFPVNPNTLPLEKFQLQREKDDEAATKKAMELNPIAFEVEKAIKADSFKYEDGSLPAQSDLRIFRITKDVEYEVDENGIATGELKKGTPVGFVVGNSPTHAAMNALEVLGFDLTLHNRMKVGGGRGKTKIDANLLNYGKMLAVAVFGPKGVDFTNPNKQTKINNLTAYWESADVDQIEDWKKNFAAGGEFGHYIDHATGEWKKPTE